MMQSMLDPPPRKFDAPAKPVSARESWRPLPPHLGAPDLPGIHTRRQVRGWSLVLKARLIPCRTERQRLQWQLLVPEAYFEAAIRELQHYENENRDWPPSPPGLQPSHDNIFSTIAVLVMLAAFHDITLSRINLMGHNPVDWITLGSAHAGKIINGEWWRLVTALTLHSSWLHLASNLLIGGVFVIRLCHVVGSGLGWSLLLASGISGNLINAWLQSPEHRAVGASTAVFGAVGLLAAISLVRYRHNLYPQKRLVLPIAGALGLLAMLGAGGEQTDLGAHLFGFLSGLALGGAVEYLAEIFDRPGKVLNTLLNLTSFGIVCAAWYAALRFEA